MIINKKPVLLVVLIFSGFSVFANHIPVFDNPGLNYQLRSVLMVDYGRLDPYMEFKLGVDGEKGEIDSLDLMAGAYYRIHNNLKLGAFYQVETGAVHDDDWIFLNPGWIWQDTSDRIEQSLILDATPRILLPGNLGKSTVASLKLRYVYNFFNGQQKIMAKPGINYFYLKDREPIWNAGLYYSIYFPLNFGTTLVPISHSYTTLTG